jgi:enamine deaminase RidA (YjgF/YER057c/UK114 family)
VVSNARLVFVSGVTGAPVYHDHPHVPEVFDAMPTDAAGQVQNAFAHLDQALAAAGCRREDVVNMIRFFTDVDADQDVVNAHQAAWFGGHIPTSTTVQVTRLATDPRLRFELHVVAAAPA